MFTWTQPLKHMHLSADFQSGQHQNVPFLSGAFFFSTHILLGLLSFVKLVFLTLKTGIEKKTRRMFLLTKTKRPKKVHRNIIYSRKRFLKIKTCSAERRSES